MAKLISMLQRIKTIELIKKITNAMRLISMSTHTRLKNRNNNLVFYKNTFEDLYSKIEYLIPKKKNKNTESIINNKSNNLIIIVGSQKGLCGVFNTNLFNFLKNQTKDFSIKNKFITIGKYAYEYAKNNNYDIFDYYNNFNSESFVHITQNITNNILKNLDNFSEIIIFSNIAKTFFIQEPTKSIVYPLDIKNKKNINNEKKYIFEQSTELLQATIKRLIISIKIQNLLFESIISEQAARFLSMDSATRNAENILAETKLEYNKLRQANITKELTELSSSINRI